MSILLISILTFAVVMVCIALLYVALSIAKKENPIWRNCLFTCMVLLGIASVMIFIPSYNKYAALTGAVGVLIAFIGVTHIRWITTKGVIVERIPRKVYAVRASVFVLITGIIAAPFFVVFSNQEEVKVLQYGIFGQLRRLEGKIDEAIDATDRLITVISESRKERRAQAERDSLRAMDILQNQGEVIKDTRAIKRKTGIIERQNEKASNRTDRMDRVDLSKPLSTIPAQKNGSNLLLSPTRVHPYYRLSKPKK